MKAFYKYSGGKTRELKRILPYVDSNAERIVEPFAGSCSVSFALEKKALVSDIRNSVIDTLNVVKDKDLFSQLLEKIQQLQLMTDHDELEKQFYFWRDNKFNSDSIVDRAFRFIVIRQLVFSGIDRINNKTGKENAPFGHYKEFKCRLNYDYHMLLQNWEIKCCDWRDTLSCIKQNDFIFIDPPYRDRKGYSNSFSDNEHLELQDKLSSIKDIKWLLIHCEDDLYNSFAEKYFCNVKSHMYNQNFVGRDNTKSKVNHLYISNFDINV